MFFNKKKKNKSMIYAQLENELLIARARQQSAFYYPLENEDVDKAMAWCARMKIGIQPDHITEGKTYYKFFGYSFDF